MWSMLAGVGPILGEGNVGSFVDARGQRSTWAYRNGQALLDGVPQAQVDGQAYQLQHALPPVALLTDKLTASSGEAIVVAFRGRPNTRSFGAPTGGVPTANEGKQLSDGAILWLTVAWDADRTGRIYDDRIVPDEPVVDNWSVHGTDQDPVLQAALIWLRGNRAVGGRSDADEVVPAVLYPYGPLELVGGTRSKGSPRTERLWIACISSHIPCRPS